MSIEVIFGNIETKIDTDDWSVFLNSLKNKILNSEEITAQFLKKYLKCLDSLELQEILSLINTIYKRKEEKYIARIQMASPYYDDYYHVRLTIIPEKYTNCIDKIPFTLCYIVEKTSCNCCKKCTCDCHNLKEKTM